MKQMYFGTRELMSWVPCPAIDASLSAVNWNTSGRYLNGGGYARRSSTAGRVYAFAWNLTDSENIYSIMDYYLGSYGDGPFYFLDPFAIDTNVLPHFWAIPRVAAKDGPPIVKDTRPSLVDTAANTLRYPTKSAVYSLTDTSTFASLWIPIPEGYTFHLGVHGSFTGTAAITVQPDGGAPAALTALSPASTTRTNYSTTGTGVTISAGGEGQLVLAGMIAQVLPTGESVPAGDFISGRGHSGCDFDGVPTLNGYSAALDKQGMTTSLIEVGAWL